MSQPALSSQVQQVEAVLGVQLFERTQRRVLLTLAGAVVVARARRLLREAEDLLAAAGQCGDPFQGSWRLGLVQRGAASLPPGILPAVARLHARACACCCLREERTPVLVRELAAGGLEAAILAEVPDLGDLEREPLAQDPFLLAAPRNHPLARRRRVALADLEGAPMLLLEDGHCLRGQALAFCAQAGAREADSGLPAWAPWCRWWPGAWGSPCSRACAPPWSAPGPTWPCVPSRTRRRPGSWSWPGATVRPWNRPCGRSPRTCGTTGRRSPEAGWTPARAPWHPFGMEGWESGLIQLT